MADGGAMDYYDVERMVEDAVRPLRAELAKLREVIGAERVERQDADERLQEGLRTLDAMRLEG